MSKESHIDIEVALRRPWPYIRILKGYRCLDCCCLIEFEERDTYFHTGFCEECNFDQPITMWPRMPERVGQVLDMNSLKSVVVFVHALGGGGSDCREVNFEIVPAQKVEF